MYICSMKTEAIILKQYQTTDGTLMVTYQAKDGYINTIPLKYFNKQFKNITK